VNRRIRLGELFASVEGAALYRHILEGTEAFVARRVAALSKLVGELGRTPLADDFDVLELDVDTGYAAWASSYDTMSNALIRAEEPLIEAALADIGPGMALDAACGTGRHSARLMAAGHRTVGIDRSEAMLAIARDKLPNVEIFRTGDLASLPLADDSVDVVVCGLALTHLDDPAPAIAEVARVVRPGGRVFISDAHPTLVLLGAKRFSRTPMASPLSATTCTSTAPI
jgi:ubiquinone/menaquinone biosynthesis C-methylase UbiE